MNLFSGQQTQRRWLSGQDTKRHAKDSRRRKHSLAHRNGLLLEALEDRRLLAASLSISALDALDYEGSSIANDLTVSVSGGITTFHDTGEIINVTNSSGLTVTGDGTNTVTVSSGLASITINTNDGDDIVNIQSINAATSVSTNTGLGDTINVGSLAPNTGGTLAGIQASLSLDDAGANTTTIDDSGNTSATTFAINSGSISGLTTSPILLGSGISNLNVYGGSGGNTITVNNTSGDAATNLFSGAGDDVVSVLATQNSLAIDGSGGADTVSIGNAGSVSGISSSVSVTNTGGSTDLTVDASADGAASSDPVTIGGTSLVNLAPATISYDSTLSSLTVKGPDDFVEGDDINYLITDTPALTTLYTGNGNGTANATVTVQGTTGPLMIQNQDAYNIIFGNAGNTSGINDQVTVIGSTPVITVDDSADATGQTFNLLGDGTNAQLTAAPSQNLDILYNPSQVGQLVVLAGAGNDVLTVDFRAGNPLPNRQVQPAFSLSPFALTDQNLYFDGGTGSSNILRFLGDPLAAENYSFDSETYFADGPGEGEIDFTNLADSLFQTVGFINLTPVQDAAVATDYTLFLNNSSHEVSLTNTTVLPGATPAVLIADDSGSTPPTFESAAVANKTNITINASPINNLGQPAENDFTIDNSIQPQSLATLTINGGSIDDQFHVVQLTPGVITDLNGGDGDDTFYVNGAGLNTGGTLNANGGPSFDTLVVNSTSASPTITGTGTTDGTITGIGSPGAFSFTSIETINLTKPARAVTAATAQTFTVTEARAFTDQVVATFSNPTVEEGAVPDLGLSAESYAATINWGDSTSSPGWIVANAAGGYSILGSHTYAAAGTYSTSVVITSLGSTGTTTLGTVGINTTTLNVTSLASAPATFTSATPNVTVASAPLYALAAQISGFEGNVLSTFPTGVAVATFTDSGTIGLGTAYTATINWGDGTPTSASTQILATGTLNGTVFSVYGNHIYAAVGVYPVTVTITKTAGGAKTTAVSTATIADAPLSSVTLQPIVNATAGIYFSGPIGSFADADPTVISLTEASQDFKILVDWGDGSPESVGYLTASSSVSGGIVYTISGRHTYASSLFNGFPGPGTPGPVNSTFPITISVVDHDGAAITLSNVASVTGLSVVVTGHLDPASDSGVSHTDGITNVTQPTFVGTTSQGNVRVAVYETPSAGGSRVLIGTTTSDTTGAWVLTSNVSLGDGSYVISAIGIDSFNQIISDTVTVTPTPLVIDTVGPKVTGLFFARLNGQVQVTYQDYGGVSNGGVGLNLSTIADANNYRVTKAHQQRPYLVNVVSINPGTTIGAQSASLSINAGGYLRGGHYVFAIFSAGGTNPTGLQDIAGNALDGEYYGYLPSGNNVRGGNFVATLNAKHTVIYAPGSVIGSATPVTPPGTRPGNVIIKRVNPLATPHGKVATKLAARHSVHQSIKPKAHHS